MKCSSRNLKLQSGQSIVIIALAMAGLLAVVALGIDGSKLYSERRIAQNAADAAALAAIYYYQNNLTTANDQQVLIEAQRVAQLDQIPDTDTNASDGVNTNITASWLDIKGNTLASIPNCNTCFPPSTAMAISVQVGIPYSTFFGGFIGTSTITAPAAAIARIVSSTTPVLTQDNKSLWIGGGNCTNLTTRIGYYYADANSTGYPAGIFVNGSLVVNTEGSKGTYTGGNIVVQVTAGNFGKPPNGTTATSTDPYQPFYGTNGMNYTNGAYYQLVSGGTTITPGFPNWAYYPAYDPKVTGNNQLDASFFDPSNTTSPWLVAYKKAGQPYGAVVSVPGGDTEPGGVIDSTASGSATPTIYYIDGDLTINGTVNWPSATLIVKGKFSANANSSYFGTAGVWGFNISVLAGSNPGPGVGLDGINYAQCAGNFKDAVLSVNANQNDFMGILYAPYGQVYFNGNNSVTNGATNTQAVIAYSYSLGDVSSSGQAQNWQFGFNQNLLVQPIITTVLMGP